MNVIGILGGVASGKSLVANQLGDLGATVLDADRVGHEILRETAVREEIRDRWGDSVFDKMGWIDRPALAKIVFENSASGLNHLECLEKITHPRIGRKLRSQIEQLRAAGQVKAVVLDAPVMMKSGWDRLCDRILFVESDFEQRLDRAKKRGWDRIELENREKSQTAIDLKRKRADVVIDNRGTMDDTLRQVTEFWQSLH